MLCHVSIHLRLWTPRIIEAANTTVRWMGIWTVFLFETPAKAELSRQFCECREVDVK
jgi:hypothetical protein